MPIRYRDRLNRVLGDLEGNPRRPEAIALAKLIRDADARGDGDQVSLSNLFERMRDLVSWAKATIDQE